MTIERIAERSTVSTTTIYRQWPPKIAIITEAFGRRVQRSLSVPQTGDPPTYLVELSVTAMEFHSGAGGGILSDQHHGSGRAPILPAGLP